MPDFNEIVAGLAAGSHPHPDPIIGLQQAAEALASAHAALTQRVAALEARPQAPDLTGRLNAVVNGLKGAAAA
jgi:hypothetical protein